MKKILAIAAPLALAACGSADDANAPAEADTVEMPADDVMTEPGMAEDPAVDPELSAAVNEEQAIEEDADAGDSPAEQSADDAADAAADLEAALAGE